MSKTYRRSNFNKKQKSKRMNRYWQIHSEQEVNDFYEKCLSEVENGRKMYMPSHPYRYHSDNYYSKNNLRKKIFLRNKEIKLRRESKQAIHQYILGIKDDVYININPNCITRIID